jgi:hypothetical protein
MIKPGNNPEIKSFPIEISAKDPKTTARALGGMIMSSEPAIQDPTAIDL